MIKAKTHKAKSDKETIIDMEPVNETQKTIILKNPIFLIPFITVVSFIIILIWTTLYYLKCLLALHMKITILLKFVLT